MGRVLPPLIVGKTLPEHDDYTRQKRMRDFWRRSDRVRFDFADGADASGYAIMPQHERETADRYRRRARQATPRKYAGSIVDRFNDHVTRIPAVRPEATGPYADFVADADGAGTTLATLMRKGVRRAQVEGVEYLLADSNVAGVYATAAEEMAAGKRQVVRRIGADQVVWWRAWQGSVTEAIILMEDEEGAPFAWAVTPSTSQRIFLKLTDSKALRITAVDAPASHVYGGCPLVRVWPNFTDDDAAGDDSQIAPLAECVKRIVNIESWLYEEHQYGTFTTPVFLGVAPEQVRDASVGPGMGLCLPGDGVSIDKLGSDPAQADSLRQSLEAERRELYRIAGLSPGNPTEAGQPESGVAKAFAFNEVEAKLSAIADVAEAAENRIVFLLSNAGAFPYPGDCDWPDSFATPDLAEELELCIRTVTADLPQILKRKQTEIYAGKAFNLDATESATLRTQLDERDATAENPPPLTQPAGRMFGT